MDDPSFDFEYQDDLERDRYLDATMDLNNNMPTNNFYFEGWDAYGVGRKRDDYPYPEATEAGEQWLLGWDDARYEEVEGNMALLELIRTRN
jgi:ribosome modulation factor